MDVPLEGAAHVASVLRAADDGVGDAGAGGRVPLLPGVPAEILLDPMKAGELAVRTAPRRRTSRAAGPVPSRQLLSTTVTSSRTTISGPGAPLAGHRGPKLLLLFVLGRVGARLKRNRHGGNACFGQ